MRELERTIRGEFALDTSKLQRIVSIIQAAFSGKKYELTLVAILKNQKRVVTHDLQDLIAIDNTIANPVRHLEVVARCDDEAGTCGVIFRPESDDALSGVPISVKSNDAAWAGSLFSELEEQVDRTILRDQVSKYRQSKIFRRYTPLIISLSVMVGTVAYMTRQIGRLTASEPVFAALSEKARTAQSVEQKIDFIFEYSKFGLNKTQALGESGFPFPFDVMSVPFVVGIFPFLLVAALVIFALTKCYPGSVFLWGDYVEHYRTLVGRRSKIWNVVAVAMIVGLLINLSSGVISRSIGL